ncbi:MAG: hypothetical protein AAGD11_04090 [Planctomycetota bacterium]
MTAKLRTICLCLTVASAVLTTDAFGQVVQASYSVPAVDRTTPAMRYFARGRQAVAAAPQSRRPQVPQQQTQAAAGKPFEYVTNGPTVTPYLSLDMVQTNEGVPNYYSRVLPQIQQQQANQKQQAELRRLQQQLRLANAPGLNINPRNSGVPTTGRSSQFLNNGGYFPSLKR